MVDRLKKKVECPSYKQLKRILDCQRTNTLSESPSKKINRQALSSRARLTYLSPASQAKRKQNSQMERNSDKKLRKHEKTELMLDEEQHDEM